MASQLLFKFIKALASHSARENRIIFSLEPKEEIEIFFQSKKPGFETTVRENEFDFVYRSEKKRLTSLEMYEKLLFDCIVGDQTLFVSIEEVEASWQFIDPITELWKRNLVPLIEYMPNTEEAVLGSIIINEYLHHNLEIKGRSASSVWEKWAPTSAST